MRSPHDLLAAPIVHDVVIGDFGRDATVEYLRLVALAEKTLIEATLRPLGAEFFDEYRRLMFTVLGDIAFFKKQAISACRHAGRPLTDAILFGEGFSPVPDEAVRAIAIAAAQACRSVLARGCTTRVRLVLPCNGLTGLATAVASMLSSEAQVLAACEGYGITGSEAASIARTAPLARTVPETVIKHVLARHGSGVTLLVLGTPGSNSIYRRLAAAHGVSVVTLDESDYEVLTRAVVASIGGRADETARCRAALIEHVIAPRLSLNAGTIVIEACTDFTFNVGLSSLQVFADALVTEAYEEASRTEASS